MALNLQIVSPRGTAFAGDVDEVVLPGRIGELSVLPGHVPLLAALSPGVARWLSPEGSGTMAVGAGFAEVGAADKVLVLVENYARPDAIDSDAVTRELRAAEEALRGWGGNTEALDTARGKWEHVPEHQAILDRIAWAQARLAARNR